jgi:SAM-dependent methyltransferase
MLWVYSRVKENSKVLDFGCGSGTLACLKRKKCEVKGIDISKKAIKIAKKYNKYDEVFSDDIFSFKHKKGYFDYIVSLDVFGHIPFEDKDNVIKKLKEFLKSDGIMLHGIECGQLDYESMSEEELKSYIQVDGHVGIEGKRENIARFSKIFENVRGEVRYVYHNMSSEYIRQYENYHFKPVDNCVYKFLKELNIHERRIFDIANGLAMIKFDNAKVPSKDSDGGFLFLEASDVVLPNKMITTSGFAEKEISENYIKDDSIFFKGWYDTEKSPKGFFRWSNSNASIDLNKFLNKTVAFKLFSNYPRISKNNINIFILDSFTGKVINQISLDSNNPVEIKIRVNNNCYLINIFVETTWKPSLYLADNNDSREIGIAIKDLRCCS